MKCDRSAEILNKVELVSSDLVFGHCPAARIRICTLDGGGGRVGADRRQDGGGAP